MWDTNLIDCLNKEIIDLMLLPLELVAPSFGNFPLLLQPSEFLKEQDPFQSRWWVQHRGFGEGEVTGLCERPPGRNENTISSILMLFTILTCNIKGLRTLPVHQEGTHGTLALFSSSYWLWLQRETKMQCQDGSYWKAVCSHFWICFLLLPIATGTNSPQNQNYPPSPQKANAPITNCPIDYNFILPIKLSTVLG